MLRKIRIGISVALFTLITFYFLDFAGILPNSFHRLAHIQFIPALLSFSIGVLIFLCLLYTSPSPRDTERSRMPSSA